MSVMKTKNLKVTLMLFAFLLCCGVFMLTTSVSVNAETVSQSKLSFNTGGGSLIQSVTADPVSKLVTRPADPVRANFTFLGWYKEAWFFTEWDFSKDVLLVNQSIYAKWENSGPQINFVTNGGASVSTMVGIVNQTIVNQTMPTTTKVNYVFAGWYDNSSLTGLPVTQLPVKYPDKGITYYAKWDVNPVSILFNLDGGTAESDINMNGITGQIISTRDMPSDPSKTGYTFGGWFTTPACTIPQITILPVKYPATDIIYYAKWTINTYTVNFDSQSGSAVASKVTNYNTAITTPIAPTKTGYTFVGWYNDAGCTSAYVFNTLVTGDDTLFAKWTPRSYTVSFNSQSGSLISPKVADYNTTITTPVNPMRTGYTFSGWFKESGCINSWSFDNDKIMNATTIYAKWTINTYRVTFNSQCWSEVDDQVVNYNTCAVIPTAPAQAGHAFVGWYKDSGGTTPFVFATDKITDNITVFAKWTTNSYTVSFDSQSGSAVSSKVADYYATITTPPAPVRTGYTFGGWFKQSACTDAWVFGDEIITDDRVFSVVEDNTILYAKWTINTYTVNFDSQSGTAVAPIVTNYNTVITAPTAPSRTGYTFGGWYNEVGCTSAYNFSTLITADDTLYAKWTINIYTVTFDSQSGSAVAPKNTNYNTSITAPTSPTRTGYTFGGWFKESACTNVWTFASDKVMDNTTLYAKWTINVYAVTFDSQSGSAVAPKNTNYNTAITAPTAPTRTGYTFGGWFKESGCTTSWTFATDKVVNNTTLYAKWTINTYTVSFDSQSGTAVSSIVTNYNTVIATPTAPTRTGYTFGGWFNEAGCTSAYVFSTPVTADDILYAKWTINTYTVTFDSQSGSAVTAKVTNYNTAITAPIAPTRTGYTFVGWYNEPGCTSAYVFSTLITANDILYAKWTINSYTVTFDSQSGSAVTPIVTNYNTSISSPTAPTRTGYTFGGWYNEAGCTNAYIFSILVTANDTLYAKWTINTYTVSFDSQGGTAVTAIVTNYNTAITTPTAPTRSGYTFGGWYNEAGCTSAYVFSTLVTANDTLFAKWTPISYTVSFDSQGGNVVTAQAVNYDAKATSPTAPTKTGYVFAGWFKQSACTDVWTFTSDTVAGNTTLYAKWTINTYTVSFDSQSGSAVTSQAINYGAKATTPTAPTRTGYTFSGWFKESACTNSWTFTSDTVTGNTTLYAKWTPISYAVTFNSQSGSAVTAQAINYNEYATTPTVPTRAGYTFGGWYKEVGCTTSWTFASDKILGATTIYAKWTINTYTVTFNSQSGSAVTAKVTNYNTAITAPTAPTKTGYTFGGWYIEAGCTNAYVFSTPVTADDILYAKWTINTYTVTFDSQSGSAVTPIVTNYNTAITAPTVPTRAGYTFGGWYNEAGCTSSYVFSTLVTVNDTLYAKWTANTCTVSFDTQGGTVVTAKVTNYNTAITTPTAPTKTGYTFAGWYTEAACTNVYVFSTLVTADDILYAKWTIATYTVSFDAQGGTAVTAKVTNYNTAITTPTAPTRAGYTFGGWFNEAGCTNSYVFSTLVTANDTLYAKWTINTYTVTFDSVGGTAVASQPVNYNAKATTPTAPTKAGGYTFAGWYKDSGYTDDFVFASDVITGNTTLYAKWEGQALIDIFPDAGFAEDIRVNMNTRRGTPINTVNEKVVITADLDGVTSLVSPSATAITGISKLPNLILLNISDGNKVTVMPTEIGLNTKLEVIYASNENLTTLPTEIGNLKALKILSVNGSQITSLPTSMGGMTSLQNLNVGSNLLTALPSELGNATGITTLVANANKISAIPDNFNKLTGLTTCNFADNKLEDISAFYPRMNAYSTDTGWDFSRQIVTVDVIYRLNSAHTDIGDPNMNTPEVLRDMYQSYENYGYDYQTARGVPLPLYETGTTFTNETTHTAWQNGTDPNSGMTFNQQRLFSAELQASGTAIITTGAKWFWDSQFIFNYTPSVDPIYDTDRVERVFEYEPGQNDSGSYVLAINGLGTGITEFPTWSDFSGQDDIVWYSTYNGKNFGTDSALHNSPSLYHIHAYAGGVYKGAKTINVNQAMHDGFYAYRGGNLDFVIKNPRVFGGIKDNVCDIAIWNNDANGSDDVCWITATEQSAGTYTCFHPYVHDSVNHNQGGSFVAHFYLFADKGFGSVANHYGKLVGINIF